LYSLRTCPDHFNLFFLYHLTDWFQFFIESNTFYKLCSKSVIKHAFQYQYDDSSVMKKSSGNKFTPAVYPNTHILHLYNTWTCAIRRMFIID